MAFLAGMNYFDLLSQDEWEADYHLAKHMAEHFVTGADNA
jgi:hypothetical protein